MSSLTSKLKPTTARRLSRCAADTLLTHTRDYRAGPAAHSSCAPTAAANAPGYPEKPEPIYHTNRITYNRLPDHVQAIIQTQFCASCWQIMQLRSSDLQYRSRFLIKQFFQRSHRTALTALSLSHSDRQKPSPAMSSTSRHQSGRDRP